MTESTDERADWLDQIKQRVQDKLEGVTADLDERERQRRTGVIAKKTEARASRWCYISYNTVVFHICRSERGSRDGLSALQKMNGSSRSGAL